MVKCVRKVISLVIIVVVISCNIVTFANDSITATTLTKEEEITFKSNKKYTMKIVKMDSHTIIQFGKITAKALGHTTNQII